MSAVDGGERILLSGPPRNLKAVVRAPSDDPVLTVGLKLAGQPSIQRAYIRSTSPGVSELRLKLPRETPPGTYRGEAVISRVTHEVVVEVQATPRMRVAPTETHVVAEPGGRADFTIVVSNHGNVTGHVPATAVFDLDDADGQDRALGRSLRAALGDDERRVDRFFEELRASHGGEARVTVLEGAGSIEPGESRTLHCRVEVPMTTQPGLTYQGGWRIDSTGHGLAIEVSKPGPRQSGRKPG